MISSEKLKTHAKLFFLEFNDARFGIESIYFLALEYVKKNEDFKYKDVVNSEILIDLLSDEYGFIEKQNDKYFFTEEGLKFLELKNKR